MIALGWGLLGSILLSFGCLVAAIRSLLSITRSYNRESRILAITGFIAGLIASAFFAWVTIRMLGSMEAITNVLTR